MKYFIFACLLSSQISAVEIMECPVQLPVGFVVLQSNQQGCVQLKVAVAKQSQTIRDTIKDFGKSSIIPINVMDNSQLRDIATIMDQTFEKADNVLRSRLLSLTGGQPYRLIRIIKDANFLASERILNAGIDLYSKMIFGEDLPKLGTMDARSYASYKEDDLENLPTELAHKVIQRNWRLFPPTLVARMKHSGEVKAVTFSADGKTILTGTNDSKATLWNASEKPLAIVKQNGQVRKVSFSPDGKFFLTASTDKTAKLWETNEGNDPKLVATFRNENAVTAVAFSPDGKFIVTGLRGPTAKLWDASSKGEIAEPIATFRHGSDITAAAFSSDGKTIWTAGSGRNRMTVKQWSAEARGENNQSLATLERSGTGVISGIAFSHDAGLILTGSDKTTDLWDTHTPDDSVKPLATLKRGVYVWDAAFSDDGKYIVTGSDDGTVDLWNSSVRGDAKPLMTLKPGGSIFAVGFSPEAKRMLTGSDDDTAKLWDVRNSDLSSLATAQIVLYARKKNLSAAKLPKHLVNELDDKAKTYLPN